MNKLIKLIVLIGCFATSSVCAAADKWTGNKKVTSVQSLQNGGLVIYLDSEVNAACTMAGTNSVYALVNLNGVTQEGIEAFRSSAYIALTSGLDINILYDDSTAHCYAKYIVISK